MSHISYFVISYNHETQEFEHDQDTCEAHFPDGYIYDTVSEEWVKTEMWSDLGIADEDAVIQVLRIINQLNDKEK
jgi:hypothetical protein